MKSNHIDEYVSSGTSPTPKDFPDNLSAGQSVLAHPEPLLLDIHGATRALSATAWAVRSLLWDGKNPYVKIGRRFLVDTEDLCWYIAIKKSGGAS